MAPQRFEGYPRGDVPDPGGAWVRTNLERIRMEVAARALQVGRDPSSVAIVGVTKSVGTVEARWLLDAGLVELGENRPEELVRKSVDPALRSARWHLIGTYQRRKVRDTLHAIAFIHSVHSVPLARAIAAVAEELGRTVDCLMQVNVSGEASKQGFPPEEARRALDATRSLSGIRWRGLMTMAPADASPDARRRIFAETRALRDRLEDGGLTLPDLSMGMSSDYREAVLEGSTLIRIGTALFHMAKGDPAS